MGKTSYYGTYYRNLDAKGRLLIPSKLADGLGNEVYVVRGHEGCLSIYDPAGFEKLMSHYMDMDFEDPQNRVKMRMAAASVHPTKVDSVGRVLLGKQLLEDYGIEESVTLIGVFDHLEVWDQAAYARYMLANGFAYDAPHRSNS